MLSVGNTQGELSPWEQQWIFTDFSDLMFIIIVLLEILASENMEGFGRASHSPVTFVITFTVCTCIELLKMTGNYLAFYKWLDFGF